MRRLKASSGALLILASVLAIPSTAAAQGRPELGAGFNFFRYLSDSEQINFPNGWNAGIAVPASDRVAIVGKISGNYKTLPGDGKTQFYLFNGGIRVSGGSGKARPFVRAMAGSMRFSCEAGDCTQNNPTVQFGGGVAVWGTGRVGFEGAVDWARIFVDGPKPSALTVAANIVFKLGS